MALDNGSLSVLLMDGNQPAGEEEKPTMDDKKSNGWDRIGAIRSDTNPTEKYVVALRSTGYLGCSCKSWIFNKGTKEHEGFKRTCKHIRALLDETVNRSNFEATNFGTTWLMKRAEARYAQFAKPMKKTA